MIKGGGIAITGQEQRQLGGGFLEGEGAPKGEACAQGVAIEFYRRKYFHN